MYKRLQANILRDRLLEQKRFIQVVWGPRQTGKTTLVRQALEDAGLPWHYATADEPILKDVSWLVEQWNIGRALAHRAGARGAVLVIDECQKISGWSETVKRLWDEDHLKNISLKVVLLGSSPMLVSKGLTESLAGRFETIPVMHWSYPEMRAAFGWTVDQYIFWGGYPGAASLIDDYHRWSRYIFDSLIETTISRDILLWNRIEKPALLRRLFELGCSYSGQILSYTKMLGQLQDAGNTVTLAHYLDLLNGAGMMCGLQKYAEQRTRRRSSSPKFQVYNNALITAIHGPTFDEALHDREYWGRLTESAIGAYLANLAAEGRCELFYWRQNGHEVDFVVRIRRRVIAIEVKSGRQGKPGSGMAYFQRSFSPDGCLCVGEGGISIESFLSHSLEELIP